MAGWALIQHVDHEGPGLIAAHAARRGLGLRIHRPYRGQSLPELGGLEGLVSMGGPMGVHDLDAHPYLAAERELLAGAVERGLAVLGVCLGAQLLAHALGAQVSTGPAPEVGLGEVELTPAGRADPVLGAEGDAEVAPGVGTGERVAVLHWHGDTFSLPRGAQLLASSDRYANQAFRARRLAYGLQFHIEVDRALAQDMAGHLPRGVALPEAGRARVQAAGDRILGRFFDLALGVNDSVSGPSAVAL